MLRDWSDRIPDGPEPRPRGVFLGVFVTIIGTLILLGWFA